MQLKNGLFFVQLVSLYRTLEICQFSEIFSFHKYVMKQIRDLKKKRMFSGREQTIHGVIIRKMFHVFRVLQSLID